MQAAGNPITILIVVLIIAGIVAVILHRREWILNSLFFKEPSPKPVKKLEKDERIPLELARQV